MGNKISKAESEMQKLQTYTRMMLETSLDPEIITGPDGLISYVNEAAVMITGVPHEKMVKSHFRNYFTDPHNAENAYREAIVKGSVKNYSLAMKHVSGKITDVLYNITVYKDESGSVNSVFAVARDITEIKKIEVELRHTNEFIDSVLENIPNMVYVKEVKELRYIRFNKAAEKLLGFSKQDVIGKTDYDLYPKEQADFFTKKDHEAIKNTKLLNVHEETIFTKTGDRWLHTKKITITDEKNNPVYLLGISEDITERKKLEREVADREKEEVRLEELEKFRKLTVGRELKMIELKKEIDELKNKIQSIKKNKNIE